MPDREPRQILITRPEPDAAATARLVAGLGWEPVLTPMLALRPGAVAPAPRCDAVLVTSRNAIPALPPALAGLPLLAVGAATAARARAAGFATVLDADGDAADLAALARRELPPGARLLVAHARGQGRLLIAALRAAGFRVHPRRAYAMAPARRLAPPAAAALRQGGVHAALFLSAETAGVFVRLLPGALQPHLAVVDALAIGPAAAAALAPLPWRRVRVSVRPTLDHVLALL